MRKMIASIVFLALAGTLAMAAPNQDRNDHRDRDNRHDNGKHKGDDKHGDDRGDRHDNGNHKGWDNPHNPHASWNSDHDRIRPGRSYPYGRYEHVRSEFIARRMDFRTRRVVLYDNSNWVVASVDLDRRSEEHTSELQSRLHLVCRLLLEKKKKTLIICFSQSLKERN